MTKRRVLSYLLYFLCIVAMVMASCTTKSTLRLEKLSNATSSGDFKTAIQDIKKNPKLYGKHNQFLFYMDIGVLYHYDGNVDSSNYYLLKAADIYDQLFARSVTNEAAAIMVNDNIRPYRSKPYELVMLHQYIALNYLKIGMVDEALVETRRTQLLFNEWERKDRSGSKYTTDGMFHYLSSIAYDAAGEPDDAMISLYKAIKAYQDGPLALPDLIRNYAYFMFALNDRTSDNELLGLTADVPEQKFGELQNNQSEIIVIGYAGRAPALGEGSWWGTYVKDGLLIVNHTLPDGKTETMNLPAPLLPEKEREKAEKGEKTEAGTTFHIKFALPELRPVPSKTSTFTVRCSAIAEPVRTVVINDLEKQAAKNLEDTRPKTLARTVVRVVLRTIAAQKAKERIQTSSAVANLLLNVGTDILTDQMEKADTRSCFLLPKTIQIARIAVKPGTYSVNVSANDASGSTLSSKQFKDIKIGAHQKKFIFCSSFK